MSKEQSVYILDNGFKKLDKHPDKIIKLVGEGDSVWNEIGALWTKDGGKTYTGSLRSWVRVVVNEEMRDKEKADRETAKGSTPAPTETPTTPNPADGIEW
jgi:hypothetical protein